MNMCSFRHRAHGAPLCSLWAAGRERKQQLTCSERYLYTLFFPLWTLHIKINFYLKWCGGSPSKDTGLCCLPLKRPPQGRDEMCLFYHDKEAPSTRLQTFIIFINVRRFHFWGGGWVEVVSCCALVSCRWTFSLPRCERWNMKLVV